MFSRVWNYLFGKRSGGNNDATSPTGISVNAAEGKKKVTIPTDKPEQKTEPIFCVAAIDIGTAYSGFAFSFTHDKLDVWSPTYPTGAGFSEKTPTSILLTPDVEFHRFGFEAENKYVDLIHDGVHAGWRFFTRFKMMLHQNKVYVYDTYSIAFVLS